MTGRDGMPRLKRDWIGRKVRTRREIRNGLGSIPAGTVMNVIENRSGLALESARCDCCGVRFFVRRVAESVVDLLPEGDPTPLGPGAAMADDIVPETRVLDLSAGFVRKHVGTIYDIACPFCTVHVQVRKSTLNTTGKRCGCGALLTGRAAKRGVSGG